MPIRHLVLSGGNDLSEEYLGEKSADTSDPAPLRDNTEKTLLNLAVGMLRNWPAEDFRATLQGFFFPASIFILASHAVAGLWTREVFRLVLISLPAIMAALLLARGLDRFITNRHAFDRYVHVFLVTVGGLLIGGALRG